MKQLFAILTWQTHEGGGGNPPRIAREKFAWNLIGYHELAIKRNWLRENGIAFTLVAQED
jgi:hypothetical protein